jgi:DNA-binding MarR family transcriptional regulator
MEIKPPSRPLAEPPLPARLGQRLGIVAQLYTGLVTRLLEPHDLTWPQFALLLHLARRGSPGRISDMAAAVDLTQPAVTKIVQKFATMGLVEVARDTSDQRNRPVRITALGQERLGAVQRSFGPAFDALLEGWDEAALERLVADLARLSNRLELLRNEPHKG